MEARIGRDADDETGAQGPDEIEAAQKRLEQRRAARSPQPRLIGGEAREIAEIVRPHRMAQEERRARIERLLRPEAVDRILRDYGVGERLRALELDESLIPPECRAFVANVPKGGNMILAGPPGSGKTTAAMWCLRQLYIDRISLGEAALHARFIKIAELYRKVFDRDRAAIERVESCAVLVLDDWGGQYEHAWPLGELEAVIDRRWESLRPTIVTTNLNPDEGPESIREVLPRSYDRLVGHPGPGVVILDRASLRRRPEDSR